MYGKHFQSMYTGSMVGSGAVVFAVWGYVIANKRGSDHSIEINPSILSTIIGESVGAIQKAIDVLCKPDPRSRSKEFEGRRLVLEAPFLYKVVNGPRYGTFKDEDSRRVYMREYMKSYRTECKPRKHSVNSVKLALTQEDVDVNEDAKQQQRKPKPAASTELPEILQTPEFKAAWEQWQKHRSEKKKPQTPTSVKQQLKRLGDWGLQRAISAIEYSIANGWEGIYEEKNNGNAQGRGLFEKPTNGAYRDPRQNADVAALMQRRVSCRPKDAEPKGNAGDTPGASAIPI